MTSLEDRLRDAFAAAAGTVRPESVGVLREPSRPARIRRLAPLAAAAAVAIVIVAAAVITPLALAGGPTTPSRRAGPAVTSPTAPACPSGAAANTVPDVIGMVASRATVLLMAAGLRVSIVEQVGNAVSPGTVIAQSPAAGTRTPPGATIVIAVAAATGSSPAPGSAGAPSPSASASCASNRPITVPLTVGMPVARARTLLSALGLLVMVQVVPEATTVPVGIVLGQNPAAGTRVESGAKITLRIGVSVEPPSSAATHGAGS